MSKKFTGITSAGSAIPVYDKDAHSALEQKLDTSAFSSVSGEFATIDDVVAAVSGKADTSAIPSLDGYATEEWVGEQGYLTEVPDEYAKTSAVEDMVSAASADLYSAIGDKLDTSSFADVSGSFLTEVPESAVSGFATHEEVDEATSGKMDVSGLASGSANQQFYPYYRQFYSGYNGIPFYAAYISGDKLDTSAATAVSPNFSQNNNQNIGSAKFSGWLDGVGLDLSSTSGFKRIYITDEGITLSGYSSENDKWRGENAHYLNINHENYVDKTKFKNIVASDNEIYVPNYVKTVSGNYDTVYSNYSFIGDFSGNDNLSREFTVTLPVATTSFTYTAAQQNWGWLYIGTLTSEDPKTVWKFTPNEDYNEINSEVSTATFYTLQITQSPFPYTGGVVSASLVTWNDEVFATRPWVEEQLSANVPRGVMQTSGLEYDGDKISGYMGSAFAGGGEVPEGVMVESAVGYNAVNEISGYNGSAIAQYGAEKQWLVHDDTLVHAANSAQYALGVNLSAVAQLLGVDETVLFESTAGTLTDVPLSESYKNFNKIKVAYDICYKVSGAELTYDFGGKVQEFMTSNVEHAGKLSVCDIVPNGVGGSTGTMVFRRKDFNMTDSAMNFINDYQLYWNGSTWSQNTNNQIYVFGVTGIGRKEV